MSGPEPGWKKYVEQTDAYTRPLLGSEIWTDQTMRLDDGLSQFAIGVQFTTTLHERDIDACVKEAVIRLRFECPLVAATIKRGLHDPEFGSWLYPPLANVEAAHNWADRTVHYLPDPMDPSSFLQSIVEKHKIPYVLPDDSEQYLRVYLTRPDSTFNMYFLSLHVPHSILDARPGLNALSLLLEWMTTPDLGGVADLAWGTEHKNLPMYQNSNPLLVTPDEAKALKDTIDHLVANGWLRTGTKLAMDLTAFADKKEAEAQKRAESDALKGSASELEDADAEYKKDISGSGDAIKTLEYIAGVMSTKRGARQFIYLIDVHRSVQGSLDRSVYKPSAVDIYNSRKKDEEGLEPERVEDTQERVRKHSAVSWWHSHNVFQLFDGDSL